MIEVIDNHMCLSRFLFVLFFIIVVLIPCQTIAQQQLSPLVWDMTELNLMKTNYANDKTVKTIVKSANKYCFEDPIVVTDAVLTFAPDNHYYCSVGPYWWPDSLQNGKYIQKDGMVNPDSKLYANGKLNELAKRCESLGKAFYFTEKKEYYDAFYNQIKAWFVNKDTFMYPNFEYSQVVPGINNNQGRSTGFIGAYAFNTVIESIRLVNEVKKIDRETLKHVRNWFMEFAKWAEKGDYGERLRSSKNNIGLAYDVTLVNMYLFAKNTERAKEIADGFALRRINVQIKEDGSQPEELKRTKAFSYSLSNLTHIIDFCYLVRYWYPNYYLEHRNLIDKSFEFLQNHVDNHESFPYKQITSWGKCKRDFALQHKRLLRLRKK